MSKISMQQVRKIVEASTPNLVPGLFRSDDHADQIAQFAETLVREPAGPCWVVAAPVDGKPIEEEAKYAAITGNGPTSEANARFFSMARAWLLATFDEVERLEHENAKLRAELVRLQAPRLRHG